LKLTNLAAVALIFLALLLFILAFNNLPLGDSGVAIDWKQIWNATHGFTANYGNTELRNPPWILPLLWPITLFPLGVSWALASAATLIVLVFSVPRQNQKTWFLGTLLLVCSFPALRQVMDGNLEAFVIAGVILALWGAKYKNPWALALGILLAAVKIQETWLFLFALSTSVITIWPRRSIMKMISLVLVIAVPFILWKGNEWSYAMLHFPWPGSAIDSSLQATVARIALPLQLYWLMGGAILSITLGVLWRRGVQFSRSEAGLLVTASLLLAPYAASNSVLTPLAVGVIPLLQRRPIFAISLVALHDLPFIALGRPDLRSTMESSYWTLVLLVTWVILVVDLAGQSRETVSTKSSFPSDK
jgi:hypothetical protein